MMSPQAHPAADTRTPRETAPAFVLGLVGGIGAGKSVVADQLGRLGAIVIDADAVGHAVLGRPDVRDALVERFGNEILRDEEPKIDRKRLGRLVFSNPEHRHTLESVVHPLMRHEFATQITGARSSTAALPPLVVLDAAILFEAGWHELCDRVLFVDAPRPLREHRLQAMRGWDAEELARRESAQWPLQRKRERSDAVLVNDGSPEEAGQTAVNLVQEWLAERSPNRSSATSVAPARSRMGRVKATGEP